MQKTENMSKIKLFTLKEAAAYMGKSIHNISYLITYGRINKYSQTGKIVKKINNGITYVSKKELDNYSKQWSNQLKQRRDLLKIKDQELAFYHLSEKERTKHIHRLHPYLGKFIPQLVEYYLQKYFKVEDLILDPFMGSGTTLAVCSELGMKSIGIDISEFNCMIARAKLEHYDLEKVSKEIDKIYNQTKIFSDNWNLHYKITDPIIKNNDYLNSWFAKRSLAEISFYKSKISEYEYQDILKIILTRAARSSRLVHHYDIATPRIPIKEGESYTCRKHLNKLCMPLDRAIGKIKIYSNDTKRRIQEFSELRQTDNFQILHNDSRTIDLQNNIYDKWKNKKIDGIFTSPPYVGQIDYHEQHRYAYEIFGIPRDDDKEIGRKKLGKSKSAHIKYQTGISEVFANVIKAMNPESKIFIVANDKFNLYPKIIKDAGLEQIGFRERPVEARAEGDKAAYSEKIFECGIAKP
ncbi:DNA modification methylase [Candidatus Nitrosarchaeum limnium SFB1]|jgi:DNA modification methylase|uniref:Type II methyltransferase n=1 Tax=Candidatus Nitrosarchaeum limnium SFB1 TaxID=886738 RepID=F3KLC0_9ARCH|nr:DNA modification methylase [Candidatus Nitrosarchaeum limnium SFB1]